MVSKLKKIILQISLIICNFEFIAMTCVRPTIAHCIDYVMKWFHVPLAQVIDKLSNIGLILG
jgi:hypothetical protein